MDIYIICKFILIRLNFLDLGHTVVYWFDVIRLESVASFILGM